MERWVDADLGCSDCLLPALTAMGPKGCSDLCFGQCVTHQDAALGSSLWPPLGSGLCLCEPGLQRANCSATLSLCPCVPWLAGQGDFCSTCCWQQQQQREESRLQWGQWREPPVAGATTGSLSLLASLKEWCGEGLIRGFIQPGAGRGLSHGKLLGAGSPGVGIVLAGCQLGWARQAEFRLSCGGICCCLGSSQALCIPAGDSGAPRAV